MWVFCEILCVWNYHSGIITTNGKCVVWWSGWIASCVPSEDYTMNKKKPLSHLKNQLRLDDHLVSGRLRRTMNPFCLTVFYFYSWLHGFGVKRQERNGCFVCCRYIVCLPYVFCIVYCMFSLSLCLPFCLRHHCISLSLGHQLIATQPVQHFSSSCVGDELNFCERSLTDKRKRRKIIIEKWNSCEWHYFWLL